jgi:hypothetical protein
MANWIYGGKSSNSRTGDKSHCMMAKGETGDGGRCRTNARADRGLCRADARAAFVGI